MLQFVQDEQDALACFTNSSHWTTAHPPPRLSYINCIRSSILWSSKLSVDLFFLTEIRPTSYIKWCDKIQLRGSSNLSISTASTTTTLYIRHLALPPQPAHQQSTGSSEFQHTIHVTPAAGTELGYYFIHSVLLRIRGGPETFGRPGQVNNSRPLQTDFHSTFSAYLHSWHAQISDTFLEKYFACRKSVCQYHFLNYSSDLLGPITGWPDR